MGISALYFFGQTCLPVRFRRWTIAATLLYTKQDNIEKLHRNRVPFFHDFSHGNLIQSTADILCSLPTHSSELLHWINRSICVLSLHYIQPLETVIIFYIESFLNNAWSKIDLIVVDILYFRSGINESISTGDSTLPTITHHSLLSSLWLYIQ